MHFMNRKIYLYKGKKGLGISKNKFNQIDGKKNLQ